MCFLDQLRSSSAPDLTLAIRASVPKGLIIIYLQGAGKYRGSEKIWNMEKVGVRGFFMLGERVFLIFF